MRTIEHMQELAAAIAAELGLKKMPLVLSASGHYYDGLSHEVGIHLSCTTIPLECALAHEMRHAFQYENGWLRDGRQCLWTGKIRAYWHGQLMEFIPESQEEYEKIPWEADANEWAQAWYARYTAQRRTA